MRLDFFQFFFYFLFFFYFDQQNGNKKFNIFLYQIIITKRNPPKNKILTKNQLIFAQRKNYFGQFKTPKKNQKKKIILIKELHQTKQVHDHPKKDNYNSQHFNPKELHQIKQVHNHPKKDNYNSQHFHDTHQSHKERPCLHHFHKTTSFLEH